MLDLVATSISCELDPADRAAIRELARRHKTTVSRLVRDAIDAKHGKELAKIKPYFVDAERQSVDERVGDKR